MRAKSTWKIKSLLSLTGLSTVLVFSSLASASKVVQSIPAKELVAVRKRLSDIFMTQLERGQLVCDLKSGGINYRANETLSMGAGRNIQVYLSVATEGTIDRSGEFTKVTLRGPFAWYVDEKAPVGYYKGVKEEVTLTISADNQSVLSATHYEYRNDPLPTGDLLHPTTSHDYRVTAYVVCDLAQVGK